uniref:2-C-methyl-D-erythritol 2,4-cyclodiphosphate synthase n=1 Tax=Tetradesmus obliquus TaxID=3088 RepID=A0A383VLB4_TETOB|eukprot:jgi/Sobl393_1/4272/SZX65713.1
MSCLQQTSRANLSSVQAAGSRRICPAPFTAARSSRGQQSSCQARQQGSNSCFSFSSRAMGSSVATRAAAVEAPAPPALPYRVGHGFDLHRLAEGYKLVIGGIEIPHTKGCEAHSDGDVLLHTVTDAILGALSLPDIGQLFPDNDPTWKGASSDIFVKEAVKKMKEAGYVLGNLDCTIIAQKPKLSPHKETIRANLCKLLEAHPSVINIKAKTHEKVDSIGEERSIGCHAVIMLIRKDMA